MKEYGDLTLIEQMGMMQTGMAWFEKHRDHVLKLVQESKSSYSPCGGDLFHPEFWKSEHWKWFIEFQELL
jgi:hypothetical protein